MQTIKNLLLAFPTNLLFINRFIVMKWFQHFKLFKHEHLCFILNISKYQTHIRRMILKM